MPITLGCPSCGKRFRARDESAGKKVKCPYCQAAVQVPTAEESASASAPTAALPPPPPAVSSPRPAPPPRPLPPPPAPVVASPDDWGALPTGPKPSAAPPKPSAPPPPPPPPEPDPVAFPPAYSGTGRGAKERPKPAKATDKPKAKAGAETPEQVLADGWRKVRRGLFRVQFGLFLLALMAFVGFGKMVAARTGNELPTGPGWIKIDGYINDPAAVNSVPLTKTEELNLAFYGLPVMLGGLLIVFGRITAGGAPGSSGARGMFALSGLFLLIGLAGLLMSVLFDFILMRDEYRYTRTAFLVLAPLAEYWFLTSLTACGLALKRPKVARAVGLIGFVAAVGLFAYLLGWDLYKQFGRPKAPDADVLLYEQGAIMLGWLLLIGVYWRAIGGVRSAAREFLDTVDEGA